MSREAARARKARQRERQREAARIMAETQAARLEADAEHLAPAVMRNAVMAGHHMLIGPRVQITNGRAARADPIAACKSFTADQKRAARQLQLDWNDVGCGIGVGAVDYLRSGGGGSGDGGHAVMMEQIHARARLEGAMAFCGALSPAIARVVLDCVPVNVYAAEVNKSYADAVAWISIGLTRLASFYFPKTGDIDAGIRKIRTFAPSRSAYSIAAE